MMKMNQRKIRRVEVRVFIWFCCQEEDGRIGSKRRSNVFMNEKDEHGTKNSNVMFKSRMRYFNTTLNNRESKVQSSL